MRSLTLRLRSAARRGKPVLQLRGMRNRTSPFGRGGAPLRPVAVKGTAKREARMPTATSFRLLPRGGDLFGQPLLQRRGHPYENSLSHGNK